jgi:ABC-type lipoprotein export system ATPase subunit
MFYFAFSASDSSFSLVFGEEEEKDLPILDYHAQIIKSIRENSVTIINGKTGSGKASISIIESIPKGKCQAISLSLFSTDY